MPDSGQRNLDWIGQGHPKAPQETNIVELDPVFREFLMFKPVLQMCYDCFGPMFHLGQDKWTRKYRKQDLPPGPLMSRATSTRTPKSPSPMRFKMSRKALVVMLTEFMANLLPSR